MSEILSVTTPAPGTEGKTRFRQVGVAFPAREGQKFCFKVALDANPVNGELIAFAPSTDQGAAVFDSSWIPSEMKVTTPVKGKDDRTRFRQLGIAFAAREGQNFVFKILLDGVPVNGELVLFEREAPGNDGLIE